MKKLIVTLLVCGVVVFGLLQLVRPAIPSSQVVAEVHAPEDATRVLRTSCYSCHSNERRLAWFDEIVPGYWLVRHDILEAREHLNFSTLGEKPAGVQRATLFEAVNMAQFGAMPLPSFVALHPDAKVNAADLQKLKEYLAPWGDTPAMADAPADVVAPTQSAPEFGGLAFDPGYTGWHLLSVTDRGDNDTFRFILGNDVAVKAAHDGATKPWPDGARFAKMAWQQRSTPDGLMEPGQFVQVEMMVKDAGQYRATEGWGWGRWRGSKLTPYGKDASAIQECTGCHAPLKRNDFVYTMPLSSAQVSAGDSLNTAVAAYAMLPIDPLVARPLTMYVDRKAGTMSVLFGDDAAANALERRGGGYPAGAQLLLVTWKQVEDPHWFGARIPGAPLSAEFVQVGGRYRRFDEGSKQEVAVDAAAASQRTEFLEHLTAAPFLSH